MQASLSLLLLVLSMTLFAGCNSMEKKPSNNTGAVKQNPPSKIAKKANPEAISDASTYYAQCGNQVKSMASILQPIAEKMARQKIPYAQSPSNEWRDCSGNFLRLSSYVASACPGSDKYLAAGVGVKDYRPGGNNKVAAKAKARDTRAIAKLYHEQGRFIPIYYDGVKSIAQPSNSLKKYRNHIKPGAVLWFSRSKPKSVNGVNALFKRGQPGAINHMSTVIKTTLNGNGDVQQYAMYHGRNRGKPGAITERHFWDWPKIYTSRGKKYPPLGYWGQYLVGIGTLLPAAQPVE